MDFVALCALHPEAHDAVVSAVAMAQRLSKVNALRHGADFLRGSVLDTRYELVKRIGAGAMGTVYLARDSNLQRGVAVKILHGTLVSEEEGSARFEREATALAAIQSSSIVAIHDRGFTEGGAPFLVMERIDGVSLSELLDEAERRSESQPVLGTRWITETFEIDPLREESYVRQVVRWTVQVGEGLQAAHGAKVIHRDIKPSNIMLRSSGEAVLLDFGIAALETGNDGSHSEVMRALSTREVPPLASVRSGLPKDLMAIVEQGVERDPKRRYQTASELVEDLEAFLEHRPVSARPISSAERFLRRVRRSRAVQGAVAATVLFVLATAGFAAKRADDARGVDRGHIAWQQVPNWAHPRRSPADDVPYGRSL